MAQRVKTVHDVGASQGLLIANPQEDEARAKEASSRAERALRAQLAAQAVAMSGGGAPRFAGSYSAGSGAAEQGSRIANPWNRPDDRPQGVSPGHTVGDNSANNPWAQAMGRQFAGSAPSMGMSQPGAVADPSDPRTWSVHQSGRASGNEVMEGVDAKKLEGDKLRLAQSEALSKHAMNAAQMLHALEVEKRQKAEGSRGAAQALLAPFMEKFTSGNFEENDVDEILKAAMADPGVGGGISSILSSPEFDNAIVKNNTVDLRNPIRALELGAREFAGKNYGWFGNRNPMIDAPDARRQRAEGLLKKLREMKGMQDQPGGDGFETFLRSLLKQFEASQASPNSLAYVGG